MEVSTGCAAGVRAEDNNKGERGATTGDSVGDATSKFDRAAVGAAGPSRDDSATASVFHGFPSTTGKTEGKKKDDGAA